MTVESAVCICYETQICAGVGGGLELGVLTDRFLLSTLRLSHLKQLDCEGDIRGSKDTSFCFCITYFKLIHKIFDEKPLLLHIIPLGDDKRPYR